MSAKRQSQTNPAIRRNGEKGMALVVALLAIVVLTSIGFALILSSSTESLIHGNYRQSGLAFYAARAGVEEARGRMGPDLGIVSPAVPPAPPIKICGYSEPPGALPTGCPTTTPDTHLPNVTTGLYIRLDTSITPRASCTYLTFDCTDPEAATDGLTTIRYPPTAQTGTQIPYVWVKITLATQKKLNRNLLDPGNLAGLNDTMVVCWNKTNVILDTGAFPSPLCGDPPNPVYIMTALVIEPGGARRIVREIGALGTVPPLPGGLVFDTPCTGTVTYPPPVSHPYMVSGDDLGSCGAACDVHAVVVGCQAAKEQIHNLISDGTSCNPQGVYSQAAPNNCQRIGPQHNVDYPGVGNNNCLGAACNANNSADIFNGSAMLAANPDLADCNGVQALVARIKQGADFTYPGGTTNIPNPGTTANPVVNVITGDASLGQADFGNPGSGIILIEGNLVLNGYPNYRGVILIIGTGSVNISGGGNGVVQGGIFLANTSTCSATGLLGSTAFDDSGGGNFQINYNSDYTKPKQGYLPMSRISENY